MAQAVWGMSLRKITSLGSNLASVTDLKEFKLHTVYALISEAIKPLQLVGQAFECKFESKFEPLLVIRPSSWGRSEALLAQVGVASTNTGRFRVGGSRCGQRQARLRKTCYHSCDTESVQESTRI